MVVVISCASLETSKTCHFVLIVFKICFESLADHQDYVSIIQFQSELI